MYYELSDGPPHSPSSVVPEQIPDHTICFLRQLSTWAYVWIHPSWQCIFLQPASQAL